mgnify:CR=1 FL=1
MISYQGKKILVTDDEPDIVEIISGMLQRIGCTTLKAYNGKQCLDIAAVERPDLIFLDIMMEHMDGWEVASRIKGDEDLKDIPIIMVTAKPLTLEDVRDRSQLIENYIMKPVNTATLRDALDDVFTARSRLERIVNMASKSGVKDEIIENLQEKYVQLYKMNRTQQKLYSLISQIYTEKRLQENPGLKNTIISLKKGIDSQEHELKRLEEVLVNPQV